MSSPKAVLISDIHFTPATLELASMALRMAQAEAIRLNVPLIVAGDTLDTKALMRAECVNRLIEIFTDQYIQAPVTYILVGNHDLLNEKGDAHSLEFLKPYVNVVSSPTSCMDLDVFLIPYQAPVEKLKSYLSTLSPGSTLIMHQGVQSAYLGHYTQDNTSLPKEIFKNFRVISGHYHRKQDIICSKPKKDMIGVFSYIGNPYSLSFGEADDGPKGFRVLHDNGTLEFIPTNLRKHVKVEIDVTCPLMPLEGVLSNDLVWVKAKGPTALLSSLKKADMGKILLGHSNFKLDLVPTDSTKELTPSELASKPAELMDSIIEASTGEEDHKKTLKSLWREVLDENT